MRRAFLWISMVLAWVVLVGIAVQLYLIASYIFGANGALDAHKTIGGAVVHPAEILIFLVSFGAWWRDWRNIGLSFALALTGTIQVFFSGDVGGKHGYVHGLHGGLVLVVIWLAWLVARREMRALGLRGFQQQPLSPDG
jgi:hypothetical protein